MKTFREILTEKSNPPIKIDKDGYVDYWSVYNQVWKKGQDPRDIPDKELASMNTKERDAIDKAKKKFPKSED